MVALLGPELTVSLPRHVTAIIGMDAFAGAMLVGLLIQKKNLLDDLGISYRLSSFDVPSEVIADLARGKLCKQLA